MPQHRYQQVLDDLRTRIGPDREFPPGSQLPTRAELCRRYGVSHAIADRVMWLLAQEGVTETLAGTGVFVREV
jgi:DNA-binding GntR family transcriptional regulator